MKIFKNDKELSAYLAELGGTLYVVGGAVRDELMGIEPHDKDYVVTGMEVSEMPFEKIVGTDFPVFLADIGDSKCEVAMARSEQKCGVGYHGFVFRADKTISITDDLMRRDLTINAIAKRISDDCIIDPFHGQHDIDLSLLCHTSKAFADDPLRVYRVARFAAKLGFSIDPSTLHVMAGMRNDLRHLKVERVWKECHKALSTHNPRRFFEVLKEVGVLDIHFVEIDALNIPDAHDGTTFDHTMNLINMGIHSIERFGLLVHDLGKGVTGIAGQPYKKGTHYGHAKVGKDAVEKLCDRLKVPNVYKDFGMVCARYHMKIKYKEMRPSKFLKMVLELKPYIEGLLRVSFIDSITRAHDNIEYMDILLIWMLTQDKIEVVLDIEKDINGNSLIEQGYKPNKHFGEVLFQRRVEEFKRRLRDGD